MLATVAQIEGLETGFELILMHHTDCGLARLDGPEQRGLMAYYFGVDEDEVAAKHLTDPVTSVQTDLELLGANPLIPRTLVVSAVMYDIESGRVGSSPRPRHSARLPRTQCHLRPTTRPERFEPRSSVPWTISGVMRGVAAFAEDP